MHGVEKYEGGSVKPSLLEVNANHEIGRIAFAKGGFSSFFPFF